MKKLLTCAALSLSVAAGSATAAHADGTVLPPLDQVNAARAAEGLGPMYLPSGYDQMAPAVQAFAVLNLERVDRGLQPVEDLGGVTPTGAVDVSTAGVDPLTDDLALYDPASGYRAAALWVPASGTLVDDWVDATHNYIWATDTPPADPVWTWTRMVTTTGADVAPVVVAADTTGTVFGDTVAGARIATAAPAPTPVRHHKKRHHRRHKKHHHRRRHH